MVDEETRYVTSLDRFLRELNIPLGYAVLGNHEYWSNEVAATVGILRARSVDVLKDEAVATPFGRLMGLDWRESGGYSGWKFDGLVAVHDPKAADHVNGNAFIAAGHTHGGLTTYEFTIFSNSRYVRGLYKLGKETYLYVSRGSGRCFTSCG